MTQSEDREMRELDSLLNDIRQNPPDVPTALRDRVMMDAQRLQPAPRQVRRPEWSFHRLLEGIGGWPALGGLAAASCVGFWIGISPPANILDPAGLFLPAGSELYYDPAELTGFGWDLQEG